MLDDANKTHVPAGWLEALARSEAQLAAGQRVPAEIVRKRLLDSIARLEAKQKTKLKHGTASRR
jgi:hypothetical protein